MLITSCNNINLKNTEIQLPLTENNILLGTLIEITTYDKALPELNQKAFERVKEIEAKMTINSDITGEILSLNKFSGKNSVKLSDDTFYVLSKGKYYSEISKGKFDITIGALSKLWNIGTEKQRKPTQNLIDEKIKLVDYNMLELVDRNKTAKLLNSDMIVDLGGIAKGYAADEIKRILINGGITSAVINVGGNIITIGSQPNNKLFTIGIQNPNLTRGEYLGVIQVEDKTIVSSGDYEKYFEEDGIKYHHIIDPLTGYPCNNELTSVSIITNQSIDADALSTIAFLMGVDEGKEFINNIDDTEAIFITKNKSIYLTDGIKKQFILLDKNFIIKN